MPTEIRVSALNTSASGGTAFTPLFVGLHDGSFDIYNLGQAASAGLEALAEDGNNAVLAQELSAADADAQTVNVVGTTPAGTPGPIEAGGRASAVISADGASNGYLSLASMLLPSNDAFFGTADAVQLFDEHGNFKGAQTLVFEGADVRDAGTEVNTEQDAAFINQTAPNTGIDENGVVTVHPGFNGSLGNPEGEQIILGGTNAFGQVIDPEAADFTRPGAQVATVHINTVRRSEGGDKKDLLLGGADDDLTNGGGGNDVITGGAGWDVLNGEAGNDLILGGEGADEILGGADNDLLLGGNGADQILGGEGRDLIAGGDGNDLLAGGTGFDRLSGGEGADRFVFREGDGFDLIRDFDSAEGDQLVLGIAGVESLQDVLAGASETARGTVLDFDDAGTLLLRGVELDSLSEADFVFV